MISRMKCTQSQLLNCIGRRSCIIACTCWQSSTCVISYPHMLQCFWVIFGLVTAIILFLLFTGEVQDPLNCLLDPGAVQNLKLELGALKGEQAKCDQLEIKVMDHRKEKSECDSLWQMADNVTQENTKLLEERHILELQLAHRRKDCEGQKHQQHKDLTHKNHQQELEIVAMKKEKKSLEDKLNNEGKKNKELTDKNQYLMDENHQQELETVSLKK